MATLTDSIKTDLYRFFAIAFNAAPGVTYMNQLSDAVQTGNMSVKAIVNVFTTKTEFTSVYPSFYTSTQFANKLIETVVGSSASDAAKTAAKAEVVSALNSGMSRGDVVYAIFNNLANKPSTDADWANTAKQMANKVAVAQYYTEDLLTDSTSMTTLRAVIANVTAATDVSTSAAKQAVLDAAVPASSQTFALTTGSDTKTGDSGNDTFDAGLSTGSLQTLNSGDRLAGGNGTDELYAVINGSVTPASMTSIENVTATIVTNASTLDLANATGVTSVVLAASTAAPTLAGVSTSVGVTLRDSALAHTITYSNVSGSADSATVNVANMSQTTGIVTTIAGIETLTLNATSSDAALGTLTAANTTKLNVTGDKALNIVDNLAATVLTVDASTNTGGVNLDFSGTNMTVTGGNGNDDFSFEAAGNVSVQGGLGNDTFRFDATGTLTSADTVTGGDGTDTLNARSEELDDFTTTPTTFTITGIERVTANTAVLAGATISLPNISATADRLTLTAANAGAATLNFNAGANTLVNTAATVGAITVDAAGTATTDSLTITHGGASAVDSLNGQALTSTDFETVTINTTGTGAAGAQTVGAISVTASTGGTPALVITGSNQLTAGVITATGGSISAAGMTSTTNGLIMTTGQNTASTITGSALADTLFGAITTAVSQTIDGGSGNDAITAGAGNDVLTGGDGADTINGGAGNDNINGGAGNDRIVISADANLTSADTVVGGDDTDTLAFTAAITDAAATFQAFSGFEVLELAPAATSTITFSNFITNQTFTRVDFGDAGGGGTLTANNVGSAVTDIRLIEGVTGETVVFDRLIDNTTNALAISARNTTAQTVTALTANDEETVTYSSATAAADMTFTDVNAGDMTSLTITGAGDLTVTNALSSTLLATVNASAATGAVSISAANSVVAVTMTAGTGGATFTGGAIADIITGGTGVDVVVGGAGNDTISTGAGGDSVTGSAGADSINVGSGTDTVIYLADTGESTTITALTNPIALSTTTTDLVTGMAAGDVILLGALIGYTATDTDTTAGDNEIQTASAATLTDNGVTLLRGSYSSGIFVSNASGADTLLVFDTNELAAATSYQAVVLVGTAGVTGTVAEVGTTNTFSITLA